MDPHWQAEADGSDSVEVASHCGDVGRCAACQDDNKAATRLGIEPAGDVVVSSCK